MGNGQEEHKSLSWTGDLDRRIAEIRFVIVITIYALPRFVKSVLMHMILLL